MPTKRTSSSPYRRPRRRGRPLVVIGTLTVIAGIVGVMVAAIIIRLQQPQAPTGAPVSTDPSRHPFVAPPPPHQPAAPPPVNDPPPEPMASEPPSDPPTQTAAAQGGADPSSAAATQPVAAQTQPADDSNPRVTSFFGMEVHDKDFEGGRPRTPR